MKTLMTLFITAFLFLSPEYECYQWEVTIPDNSITVTCDTFELFDNATMVTSNGDTIVSDTIYLMKVRCL